MRLNSTTIWQCFTVHRISCEMYGPGRARDRIGSVILISSRLVAFSASSCERRSRPSRGPSVIRCLWIDGCTVNRLARGRYAPMCEQRTHSHTFFRTVYCSFFSLICVLQHRKVARETGFSTIVLLYLSLIISATSFVCLRPLYICSRANVEDVTSSGVAAYYVPDRNIFVVPSCYC
jgi:hypothetical protein